MQTTYHLRVKKDYAASVIEDLEKMEAVEIIADDEIPDVPQWQKDEVLRRIAKYKDQPGMLIDEETFLKCWMKSNGRL